MNKKIDGIVVSTVDYKETSKILNVLTDTEGLIGILAKGSKNPKSKISATSNVLTYGTFYLSYYKGNIPTLTEVDLKDSFKNIRKDILKMNYALFLLELITQVYKHDKNKKIYDLLIEGLKKINDGYDAQIITNIIELQLLQYLGIKPVVDHCVNCQSTNGIITISSYKGGYLCENCVANEPIYQLKTVSLIRTFCYVDLAKINKVDISESAKKEIGSFIDDYYERYSGLYLKSKQLIEKFAKIEIKQEKSQNP